MQESCKASEERKEDRFQRLRRWFSNALLEEAFLYENSAIIIFTNFNLLLQKDDPTLHVLKLVIECLSRKLVRQIIKTAQNSSRFDIDIDHLP